jgi:hypothetical protein
METNPTTEIASSDELCFIWDTDLEDKIIVLLQHGVNPLLLSASTWALVQTRQCGAIN